MIKKLPKSELKCRKYQKYQNYLFWWPLHIVSLLFTMFTAKLKYVWTIFHMEIKYMSSQFLIIFISGYPRLPRSIANPASIRKDLIVPKQNPFRSSAEELLLQLPRRPMSLTTWRKGSWTTMTSLLTHPSIKNGCLGTQILLTNMGNKMAAAWTLLTSLGSDRGLALGVRPIHWQYLTSVIASQLTFLLKMSLFIE